MLKTKNLVLDTSVLIESPNVIHSLPDCNIFLTLEVLEELDKHKTRKDSVGKSARYVNRFLDEIRKEKSLIKGAELENGQTIYVINGKGFLAKGLDEVTNDNKIISVALKLNQEIGNVLVLTNDIAFRVKCDALGLQSSSYDIAKKEKLSQKSFTGIRDIFVDKSDIEFFYEDGTLILPNETFFMNEGVILKSEEGSALAIASDDHLLKKLKYTAVKNFSVEGIRPKSAEQTFALEALLDPKINLVTISGMAGCGKTLLAISTAMHHLHNKNYNKIIISRPMESSSKDIGYLPGSKEEKLAPWIQPVFDNLESLYGDRGKFYIQQMMAKGQLEIEALTYIRGRTLPNTIFIIDEAQNINYDEAKALITRMGNNSKIIFTGDLEQIDSPKLNEMNSGLSSIIEVFKKFEGATHITLRKGERSALATFAAENM